MRLWLLLVVAVSVAGVGSAEAARFAPETVYRVPVGASPRRGPADALITIVEFSDFRCGFCGRARRTVDELFRLYPGQVRLIYKFRPLDLELGSESVLSAEAALAAGAQGRFWPMHDRLFQPDVSVNRGTVEAYALELGLDMARFRADLDSGTHREAIVRDLELVQQLGVGGTPMFFVNGRPMAGAQPLSEFIRVLDDELKRAEAQVRDGVAQRDLYERLISDGALEGAPDAPRGLDPAKTYPVEVGSGTLSRGSADALVTIVVFEDFECGYCGVLRPVLDQLLREYGADLRVVYRHFPLSFHANAQLAAEASLAAAAQGKFWEMHDILFEHQDALELPDVLSYAKKLGLNMKKFRAALQDGRYAKVVEADVAHARELGVTGTPTAFVNGAPVVGARPIEVFRAMIDARKMEAEAALANGVKRPELYRTITGAQ